MDVFVFPRYYRLFQISKLVDDGSIRKKEVEQMEKMGEESFNINNFPFDGIFQLKRQFKPLIQEVYKKRMPLNICV